MNKMLSLVLLSLAFFCLANDASAKDFNLKIYTEEFPPYNFTFQNKIVGINKEIVEMACSQAKFKCTFEILPWQRAYQLTQKNLRSGLISTSRNNEREHKFQWVGPLAFSTTNFYRLAVREDIQALNISDLHRFLVGISRGDIYEKLLIKNGFSYGKNLLDFSSKNQMLNLLIHQKIDLVIGSELTIPYQAKMAGIELNQLIPVIELPVDELRGNFLALNKDVPKFVTDKLQNNVSQLLDSGQVDRIINRYKRSPLINDLADEK
ncbi:substrate-binding periplasmic protein [Aliiglaciecola lipolytica]|uniref:Solute-binding protein family 3/N-terminal domain-containing protein n=1 Tax=Aliiglaciecola lipolytica E3 TaxID=1127673 RepID=K6XY06_9ALTE|nr:transporter substrate-binding domain-containing protein [Aliiglaciecola lipolytica]GAC16546.1 hypothetical protein GLIP_3935 [Aliiglaciecola lipolytica E3]